MCVNALKENCVNSYQFINIRPQFRITKIKKKLTFNTNLVEDIVSRQCDGFFVQH